MADRVLIIGPYPPPDNGTSVNFRQFVEFARERCEVDVRLVSTQRQNVADSGSPSGRGLADLFLISSRVLRHVLRSDKIIIHGSPRFMSTVGSLYSLVFGGALRKQVYLYVNGGAYDVYLASLNPILRFLAKQCLSRSKRICVQTRCSYDSLAQHFDNLVAMPNWRVMSSRPVSDARNGKRRDGSLIRFVYAGDVRAEKGIIDLIEAFLATQQAVSNRHVRVTLDIYGPLLEDLREEFNGFLEAHSDSIDWHGYTDHEMLLSELEECDILVLPTYYGNEGHSGILIEAMSLGLPVIATRWRAASEVVTDEVSGLLCEPRDVAGLAEQMVRLALDSELRHRLGSKGREAATQFDADKILPSLCAIYGLPRREVNPA